MKYEIVFRPVVAVIRFELDEGEHVVAQPNSMLSMTPGIKLQALAGRQGAGRGFMGGLRNVLGGENFFTTHFTAKRAGQELMLAPNAYGDILEIQLNSDQNYFITRGSFLASIGDLEIKIKYTGWRGLLAKKGLFVLHASGCGTVFCQTYGALIQKDLADGETFIVDNRFVVAFSETIKFELVKATTSVKDSIFSGEGLVNRYTGPGRLYYQSRGKPSQGFFGYMVEVIR